MKAAVTLALAIAVGGLTLLVSDGRLSAGSIWGKNNGPRKSIYSDNTARNKGDSVTIVINEVTTIANSTKRSMEKKTARSAKMSGTVSTGNVFGNLKDKLYSIPDVDVSASSDNKFDGNADYDSSRSMTDLITVTVQDVLPNGNLIVLGQRQRDVAGDRQIIQISGIIRPDDVSFENTVSSEKVADFHIVIQSKGQESDMTNPGWFGRLLNWISPS
jgi:flagellar L-ring protein FlgH